MFPVRVLHRTASHRLCRQAPSLKAIFRSSRYQIRRLHLLRLPIHISLFLLARPPHRNLQPPPHLEAKSRFSSSTSDHHPLSFCCRATTQANQPVNRMTMHSPPIPTLYIRTLPLLPVLSCHQLSPIKSPMRSHMSDHQGPLLYQGQQNSKSPRATEKIFSLLHQKDLRSAPGTMRARSPRNGQKRVARSTT